MATTKQLEAIANAHGATLDWYGQFVIIDAPVGMIWAAVGSSSLTVRFSNGSESWKPSAFRDAVEDMEHGVWEEEDPSPYLEDLKMNLASRDIDDLQPRMKYIDIIPCRTLDHGADGTETIPCERAEADIFLTVTILDSGDDEWLHAADTHEEAERVATVIRRVLA